MSVPRGSRALAVLRRLLDEPRPDVPEALTEPLPGRLESDPPDPWLWSGERADPLPALRDPAAYALHPEPAPPGADADTWPGILHRPPDQALAGTGPLTDDQVRYCRASIDVTMRGGTTSGVVYPAALCELGRRFRFRNIGGASAGAIAAALVAAAELGRTRWDRAGRPDLGTLTPKEQREGAVRQGLLGIADATAWFSQADVASERPQDDQYRVAQLFRPTTAARALYRLVVAGMRGRWLGFASLLLWSFGLVSRLVTGVLLFGMPLLVARSTDDAAYLLALAWLVALTIAAAGAIVAVLTLARWLTPPAPPPPELAEPVVEPARRPPPLGTLYGALALVIGLTGISALVGATDTWTRFGGWRVLAFWFVLIVALAVVIVFSLWRILARAKTQKFGLVSGAVEPDSFRPGARGRVWDRIAGLTPSTFPDALVPWLSRSLSRLAGLADGEVLRFGHLWLDREYAPPGGPADRRVPQRLADAAADSQSRVVNLELMTTELVHGVPYRWPLRENDQSTLVDGVRRPQLFFRPADLRVAGAEMYPKEVVDAMWVGATPLGAAHDIETGRSVAGLYPLPDPWDLPVVFATRMSMALPALFQAVPLYRLVTDRTPDSTDEPHRVRDEFGARIQHAGSNDDLLYPAGSGRLWVEELWFSDGGITSNFPIHLFDAPLPLWPTVGINLGSHPSGHRHQDVWLPTDSQARTSPPAPQRGSMFGFLGAIFSTARGWADTSQTFMPAFRGRIAWVRQRTDEGGTNLFMPRATIASMALRGAVAGARLAQRFGDEAHWQRHQWLRMRVALGNLETLRRQVHRALRSPTYVDLLTDPGSPAFDPERMRTVDRIRDDLQARGGDPTPAVADADGPDGVLDWFPVGTTYWQVARQVAAGYPASDDDVLTRGAPEPAPVIRQVPPL